MSQELSRETEAREYVYCLERREGGGGGRREKWGREKGSTLMKKGVFRSCNNGGC